jgi:hypothetical protein
MVRRNRTRPSVFTDTGELDVAVCERARVTRDRRYDDLFFSGVTYQLPDPAKWMVFRHPRLGRNIRKQATLIFEFAPHPIPQDSRQILESRNHRQNESFSGLHAGHSPYRRIDIVPIPERRWPPRCQAEPPPDFR